MNSRIMVFISLGIIILDMIWFVVRVKKYGIKEEIKGDKNFILKEISIYACTLLILGIVFFLSFGMTGNIVLCGCSVLGVELANRELLNIDD